MNGVSTKDDSKQPEITEIARLVLIISGGCIIAVSLVTLIGGMRRGADEFGRTSQVVFNALLPLLGTWVGTVLAYYFSRKNFEAASNSVERLATLTLEQRLGTFLVDKEMMQLPQITMYRTPAGKTAKDVLLRDLRSQFGGKITRLPIVDDKGVVQFILHQSGLSKFLADKAWAKAPDIEKLTLQDLVDDAELKNWVTNIAYVDQQASVAVAKTKMDSQAGCQDLIVTKTGSKTEPMLGWMTNVDIGKLSKA